MTINIQLVYMWQYTQNCLGELADRKQWLHVTASDCCSRYRGGHCIAGHCFWLLRCSYTVVTWQLMSRCNKCTDKQVSATSQVRQSLLIKFIFWVENYASESLTIRWNFSPISIIWVLDMWSTNLYFLNHISIIHP